MSDAPILAQAVDCPMCGLKVVLMHGARLHPDGKPTGEQVGRIYPHKATEHPIGERLRVCVGSLWVWP